MICEYCKKPWDVRECLINNTDVTLIIDDNGYLWADSVTKSEGIAINYCPICGRKLKEVE